jgi:hypothetical protein
MTQPASVPAAAPAEVSVSQPTDSVSSAPPPQQLSPVNSASVGRLGSNDLLALHYDNCPDKDDGHAIPAGKAVVENLGINNVLVVNGTCGNAIRDRFNSASFAVVRASWGSDYLDAYNERSSAVSESANRWASVLANGGSVWVAEGGQSDVTADIVRRIAMQYPNLNRQRIHVIQHSAGSTAYNEKFTASNNLSYLKSTTSYQAIPNGNAGGNGTADLNMQSDYFVRTARSGRFASEWNAGFAYLKPDCATRTENCKLDFSDTVELLYIVNDQRTRTVDDFANNYLK